jgi:hypothetical protein
MSPWNVALGRLISGECFAGRGYGCLLLVEPSVETSLLDIAKMQVSLEKLLGVRIDVVTPRGLPESFRSKVLESAVQL